ncbi:24785_t:CDS:2 [Cetraspora pellucida]|uniref:24785_t:CDS:1 n=1 Tax=Cetraspora pellucida TaxID=1433469 RepID=A0A9N9IS31_9GLOM|nr:24785_t:CDS:2 [Cetraspora pellucida]
MNPSLFKSNLVEEGNKKWHEIRQNNPDSIQAEIQDLLATPISLQAVGFSKNIISNISSQSSELTTSNMSTHISLSLSYHEYNIRSNSAAQKAAYEKIQIAKKKVIEFESLYNIATDINIRHNLFAQIQENKDIINANDKKIKSLQKHAYNQAKSEAKKRKQLDEDLLEKIHDCIEFGEADQKIRKTVIKIRTISHLKKELEEQYELYLNRQTLSTYLWPKHPNTFSAKRYHHPAMVQVCSVSHNEKVDHPDSYYCLASVKGARTFAATFPDHSIIISQDDKSKVPLGILAVGRMFKSIETINEPISVPDHDFPLGSKMKLIPSVYLLINPKDTNDTFCSGHLTIYI